MEVPKNQYSTSKRQKFDSNLSLTENPKRMLKDFKYTNFNISFKVEKKGNSWQCELFFLKKFERGKISNKADKFFFDVITLVFRKCEDILQTVQRLLSVLSNMVKMSEHTVFLEEYLKSLKDRSSICKYQIQCFLEDCFLPYVFLAWEKVINVAYESHWHCLGFEIDAEATLENTFVNLLSNPPSNLKLFQKSVEEMQEVFFKAIFLPTVITKDLTDKQDLKEHFENILQYLSSRLCVLSKSLDSMIKTDFYTLMFEEGETFCFEGQGSYKQDMSGGEHEICKKNNTNEDDEDSTDDVYYDRELGLMANIHYLTQKPYMKTGQDILIECKKVLSDFNYLKSSVKCCFSRYIIKQETKANLYDLKKGIINANECYDKLSSLQALLDVDKNFINLLTDLFDCLLLISKLEKMTLTGQDLNRIAKHDLNVFIFNARKRFESWICILEVKTPLDFYESNEYRQFLDRFLSEESFFEKFVEVKCQCKERLCKLFYV